MFLFRNLIINLTLILSHLDTFSMEVFHTIIINKLVTLCKARSAKTSQVNVWQLHNDWCRMPEHNWLNGITTGERVCQSGCRGTLLSTVLACLRLTSPRWHINGLSLVFRECEISLAVRKNIPSAEHFLHVLRSGKKMKAWCWDNFFFFYLHLGLFFFF